MRKEYINPFAADHAVCSQESLYGWFCSQPERFGKRFNPGKFFLYVGLTLVCLFLAIFPSKVHLINPLWLQSTLAVVAALICAMVAYVDREKFVDLQSGGTVKETALKKFDSSQASFEQILKAYDNHDFNFLLDVPYKDNQPVQLEVYEDKVGKNFYLLLLAYSDYIQYPAAEEITLSGNDYDRWATVIHSIKSK